MKRFLIWVLLLACSGFASASTCLPYSTVMYNSEFSNTGSVTVRSDASYLYIDLAANVLGDWQYTRVWIFVGTQPIPVLSSGDPDTSQFLIQDAYIHGQTAFTYMFPLSELGIQCGTKLNVAVSIHALQFGLDGNVRQEGVAWAYGPNSFGSTTAWWFEYTPCCASAGCTRSSGYYKTHNQFAVTPRFDPWPLSEQTQICGVSWYSVMQAKSSDNWYKLATQWITGMLNIGDGASSPPEIDEALSDGASLLNGTCRTMPKARKIEAAGLTNLLSTYNNGLLEPPACPEVP